MAHHQPFESRDPAPPRVSRERRRELLGVLPDTPGHCLARGMLLSGRCDVVEAEAHGDGFCVVHDAEPLVVVVGRPGGRALRFALGAIGEVAELVGSEVSRAEVQTALPAFHEALVGLYQWPPGSASPGPAVEAPTWEGGAAPADGEVTLSEGVPLPLEHLSPGLRADLRPTVDRVPVAVAWWGGVPVSLCQAWLWTESLWDVSVDTLPGHRRRGHAGRTFHALAAHMARRGRRPVWGARADNVPSVALARSLGLVLSGTLLVWTKAAPPTAGTS